METSHDSLEARLERLRLVREGSEIMTVYGHLCDMPGHAGNAWSLDRAVIADAYPALQAKNERLTAQLKECRALLRSAADDYYIRTLAAELLRRHGQLT